MLRDTMTNVVPNHHTIGTKIHRGLIPDIDLKSPRLGFAEGTGHQPSPLCVFLAGILDRRSRSHGKPVADIRGVCTGESVYRTKGIYPAVPVHGSARRNAY